MLTPPPIVMSHIRPQLSLNRKGERRAGRDWIDGLRLAPSARYILLADLKLAIVSDVERTQTRLRFFSGDDAHVNVSCGDVKVTIR